MGAGGKVRQPGHHLPGASVPGEAGDDLRLRLFDNNATGLRDRPGRGRPE